MVSQTSCVWIAQTNFKHQAEQVDVFATQRAEKRRRARLQRSQQTEKRCYSWKLDVLHFLQEAVDSVRHQSVISRSLVPFLLAGLAGRLTPRARCALLTAVEVKAAETHLQLEVSVHQSG